MPHSPSLVTHSPSLHWFLVSFSLNFWSILGLSLLLFSICPHFLVFSSSLTALNTLSMVTTSTFIYPAQNFPLNSRLKYLALYPSWMTSKSLKSSRPQTEPWPCLLSPQICFSCSLPLSGPGNSISSVVQGSVVVILHSSVFSHAPHLIHQEITLALPWDYIRCLTTAYLHCPLSGVSHQHLLSWLLVVAF